MTLTELAGLIPGAAVIGNPAAEPTSLALDSRAVVPGGLFFGVPGFNTDGARFLEEAIRNGAAAAVLESDPEGEVEIPILHVPGVRKSIGPIAAAFHGYPSRRLHLVGVTGTNGKTTTTYLIEAVAAAAGRATGVIGTIGARINGELLPGERTTPEAPDLQALLAAISAAPGGHPAVAAMEVSSHALDLGRTRGCEYDVAVFTNLTQDHLDFHGDMETYYRAKLQLFTDYPGQTGKAMKAVVNLDDGYGARLVQDSHCPALTYAVDAPADLTAHGIVCTAKGLSYRLRAPEGEFEVRLRIGALFNVYNSLAAIGALRSLGFDWELIVSALAGACGVPGRFESVDEGQPFGVIVDYAHSPDGLENVLRAARDLKPRRLLTVFGCGGDRDRTKRPIMGRIAAGYSDRTYVTSDNPRTEQPDAILSEIAAGISQVADVVVEVDRRIAIARAIADAEPGDLVVIAGKGHETYQIFADRTIHFDDREEAREAIHALPAA